MSSALILLLGLVLLVKSADVLVSSASTLALRFGLSSLIVGLTIVSFGTSTPELFVTLIAGLRGQSDLAVANVIGSNMANILVVLGIAAAIRPLVIRDHQVVVELLYSLVATLLVAAFFYTNPFNNISQPVVDRVEGAILLMFFFIYLAHLLFGSRTIDEELRPAVADSLPVREAGFFMVGVAGLCLGGQWVVDGALGLANLWKVDEALVGLTIVALGTSAPELVVSAVAAYRGDTELAIGNVVGSNIFNLLWVLGLTAGVAPLPLESIGRMDIGLLALATVLLIVAATAGRQKGFGRVTGALFVCLYAGYLIYVQSPLQSAFSIP